MTKVGASPGESGGTLRRGRLSRALQIPWEGKGIPGKKCQGLRL